MKKENNIKKIKIKYGGFWIRFIACMVDYIILVVASKILFGNRVVTMDNGTINAQFDGIFILIPILYPILFWKFFNATPGKMLFKLKITPTDKELELTWKQIIIRYISYFVSAIAIFIGFFWIGFDKKKQGWHDKIAGTVVIKK